MANSTIEDIETLAKSLGGEADYGFDLPVESTWEGLIGQLEKPPTKMESVGDYFKDRYGKGSSTSVKDWVLFIAEGLKISHDLLYWTVAGESKKWAGITPFCWMLLKDYRSHIGAGTSGMRRWLIGREMRSATQ